MMPKDVPTEVVDGVYETVLANGIPWHDDAVRILIAAVYAELGKRGKVIVSRDEVERLRRDVVRLEKANERLEGELDDAQCRISDFEVAAQP